MLTHLSSHCWSNAAGSHLPSFRGFSLQGGHLQWLQPAARAPLDISKCLLLGLSSWSRGVTSVSGDQSSLLHFPASHLQTSDKKMEGNKMNATFKFRRCQPFGAKLTRLLGFFFFFFFEISILCVILPGVLGTKTLRRSPGAGKAIANATARTLGLAS